jgi:hypothetical protein
LPGNLPAWSFFCRLAPGLVDGLGGVNLAGLEAGFRQLGVPEVARQELLEKLLILLAR